MISKVSRNVKAANAYVEYEQDVRDSEKKLGAVGFEVLDHELPVVGLDSRIRDRVDLLPGGLREVHPGVLAREVVPLERVTELEVVRLHARADRNAQLRGLLEVHTITGMLSARKRYRSSLSCTARRAFSLWRHSRSVSARARTLSVTSEPCATIPMRLPLASVSGW